MARTGDEDEVGGGASVAQLSDAARRRSERAFSPDHDGPPPDSEAGIELITNVRAEDPDRSDHVTADVVLDRPRARKHGAAELRSLPDRETPGGAPRTDHPDPGQEDQQRVREILDRHHEQRSSHEPPTSPRGSAEMAPPVRPTSPRPQQRLPGEAVRRTRPRLRVAGALAVATVVAVVVVVGAEGSSTPKHHGTPAADTAAATQRITSPTSLIALRMTQATATIASEAKTAASAHTALEDKQKARAKARAHARAKTAARARAAKARQQQQAAERTHASSIAGSTAAGSTGTTATAVSSPPSSPTSSSSTGSSSRNGDGSGSSSAPAGPTGIGSAGSNCNPKCA